MATRKKKPTGTWRCRCGFACVGSEKRCPNCLTDRSDAKAPKPVNEWEEMQKAIEANAMKIRSIEVTLDILLRSMCDESRRKSILSTLNRKKG
jgi:hypothetical protein